MNKVVSIILQTVGLIGVNAFYFGVFEDFSASRWVCWVYIHLTYALLIAAIYSVKAVQNGNVYAYPKIMTATVYYFAALIFGVIMMIINFTSVVVPIIVFALFTGVYFKVYLTLMATEAASIANENRDHAHLHFIKLCSERVMAIKDSARDPGMRKAIEKAYDAIRGASVTSIPVVVPLEEKIEHQIDLLESAVDSAGAEEVDVCVRDLIANIRKRDAEIRLAR